MCTKPAFRRLCDRVERLEMADAQQKEQVKTLFKSVYLLYRITLIGGLLMLLALIYGAIGERGFRAVATTSAEQTAVR